MTAVNSPTNTQETGKSRKVFAEAILKHDCLFGLLMELEDTDAGQEIAKEYFQRKGIDDPSSHGLLPLIQMKTGVLLMFPYVSYLHLLSDSELHDPNIPDEWQATLLPKGNKDQSNAGTAKAIAIVRHSIAHLLEGESGKHSGDNQGVDFDKLTFRANIGSVEFKEIEGYLQFFTWLRKSARKRADIELKLLQSSAIEHQDIADGSTDT
jgi:hypothetical protein